MHSFEGLGAEISALLKMSGDSGDTGDKHKKLLSDSGLSVTTPRHEVSPLGLRLVTPEKPSGDGKVDFHQVDKAGVTTVTSVTTNFERCSAQAQERQNAGVSHAPVAERDGIPAAWTSALNDLRSMDAPSAFTAARWHRIITDAETFLPQWGSVAAGLGWSAHDLFGVHPAAPACRYDAMGLLLTLQGSAVVALTDTTATMRAPSGAILTFRRKSNPTAILISEIRP